MDNKLFTRHEYDTEFLPSIPKGTCSFCEWWRYQSVIKEFKHWLWIQNRAPYWYFHTMFIPKRHFVQESEMTLHEMADLVQAKDYAFEQVSKLTFPAGKNKGKLVEKFVYFHRYRVNSFDAVSGTTRPDHFHDHFTPDIDHRWDTTLDDDAYQYPIINFLTGEVKT